MTHRLPRALRASLGTAALVAGAVAATTAAADSRLRLSQADDATFMAGRETLIRNLAPVRIDGPARNVILFVADGMGVSTVTAARIYDGQQKGMSGEENALSFERFPYLALSKTYNSDAQIPDSAGTSTAIHSGVKTDVGVIGVNADVERGNCESSKGTEVASILEMAEALGLSTGVVSTARVTHATPAAAYAHAADRNWEDDKDLPEEAKANGCADIARQLIELPYGDGLEVAMGGGRRSFIPASMEDMEDTGRTGERQDGRNLMKEWEEKLPNAAAVWNKAQLDALDLDGVDHLLGLFNRSHMQYEADRARDKGGEPSLSEMTEAAIEVLRRNDKGYYLMVESGRVDHAHHAGNAARALTDAVEFANAVRKATGMVDLEDTLIVVTADHSHVFTIAGYADRGNPILGLSRQNGELLTGEDGKPYTTLGYANGPGGLAGGRPDLTNVDTTDIDYIQQATVPLSSETHSGEDVAIYAVGPMAHLFQNTVEQNYIFHVMAHALNLKERLALEGKTASN